MEEVDTVTYCESVLTTGDKLNNPDTPSSTPTDHLNCKSSLLTVNIDNNEVEKVCHEYPVDYERSHQHNVGKERGQEFSFPTQQVPRQF